MLTLLVLPLCLGLLCIAPGLGWEAQLLLAVQLWLMLGTGLWVGRRLGFGAEPFMAWVVGFVLLAYALVGADRIVPGVHWAVAAAFALPAYFGLREARLERPRASWAIGLGVALFAFVWNANLASRLASFYATGRVDFWTDILVHAGNLAGFAAPDAIGRGPVLMADTPRPFYHYVSFLPAALLPAVAGTPVLDATILAWIPLGVLLMACGIAALGLELGGPVLAVLAIAALALIPSPERLTLGNGYLSFAWLVETSPGTAYSIGIACAALAALIRWTRCQQPRVLALALALTAGCMLVRANTFVWLAPTVALGALATWRSPSARVRTLLVTAAVAGLAIVLVALSWSDLRTGASQFLFRYVEYVQRDQVPTRFDDLYPVITRDLGRTGAGILGVPLILLGVLGPWLPAFVVLGFVAWRRGELDDADALPLLLLVVAMLFLWLAPTPRSGDYTEFRHRPGPLLVAVISVWTLRLGAVVAAAPLARLSTRTRWSSVAAIGAAALVVLSTSIGDAKRPRMAWGSIFYGLQTSPELLRIAPLLSQGGAALPRFAVANQPADAGAIDDAARLVALSGVPAYLSSPVVLLTLAGPDGDEARRRMAVIGRLAAAPDLSALRAIMRTEHVTHYVVTTPIGAPFDPERREALGHAGTFAVYLAEPAGATGSPGNPH